MRILAAVLMFAFALPASAQQVQIEKLWFGEYTVSQSKKIEDPRSPTGVRYEDEVQSTPNPNSDTIVRRENIHFGFGYVVRGPGSRTVEVEEVYFLPDANGRASTSHEPRFRIKSRHRPGVNVFVGWRIGDSKAGSPPGLWILQVRYQGRVIAEQWFNLVEK